MLHSVTYRTTRLLAMGVQPAILAKVEGVTVAAIHRRRLRFELATGSETTGRFGKRGRPKKGESPDEQIARMLKRKQEDMRQRRRQWEREQEDE